MPRKILVFFSIIGIFIFVVLLTQFKPQIFKIKEVICQLDEATCPPELIEQLDSVKQESFLFSPLETRLQGLNLNLYQLESISKSWPSTIILNFSLKPNSYLLKITEQDTLLVSQNGLVQSVSIQQNLPSIEVYNWADSVIENSVEAQLHHLNLSLIQLLATQKISYQGIKIRSAQEIEIILEEDLIAIVQKEELESQIIKLSIILSELELNEIDLQINQIDLRFKFPLLKNSNLSQS